MARRTKQDENGQEAPRDLQPEQAIAIGVLLTGASDQVAADTAGVSRSTLNEWRRKDTVFIAAWNDASKQAWAEHSSKLRALRGDAVAMIERALHSEDERLATATAWKLLDFLHDMAPKGPTTPKGVEQEQLQEAIFSLSAF